MTKKLTHKKAIEYLEGDQSKCPYCGTYNEIRGDYINPETYVRPCICATCGKEWKEHFDIYGISEEGQDGDPICLPEPRMVVEVMGDGKHYEHLYLMLHPPQYEIGIGNAACLMESVFTTDEMSRADFDQFVEDAQEQAKLWRMDITIQVERADYFKEE